MGPCKMSVWSTIMKTGLHQEEKTIYPRYAAVECKYWTLWLWSFSSHCALSSQAHPHSPGFPAAGAPAQCWRKCLYSHRMDWIDELIYPKLSLKKMFELFYSWINSPVHHINSWMQLWVAATQKADWCWEKLPGNGVDIRWCSSVTKCECQPRKEKFSLGNTR